MSITSTIAHDPDPGRGRRRGPVRAHTGTRRRPWARPVVALAAALALALAACGDDGGAVDTEGPDVGAPRDGAPPTTAPHDDEAPGDDGLGDGAPGKPAPDPGAPEAERIDSRDDLLDERPADPEAVVVDADDPRTLLVRFWGGVEPCYGARVAVEVTAAAVHVELFTGTPPEGRGAVCIQIAIFQEIAVTLDAPLGDRELHW